MIQLDDGCSYIPFCSRDCYRQVSHDHRPNGGRDRLFWHDGETRPAKIGGNCEIRIHPMTDRDRAVIEHYRGRETFSYGSPVLVLPSAIFYGKRGSPIYWQ